MKIEDQIKNRVLSLPAEAFYWYRYYDEYKNSPPKMRYSNLMRPQTIFIDQMDTGDWLKLYDSISPYYASWIDYVHVSFHFSLTPCLSQSRFNSSFWRKFCFCTKTKTWHRAFDPNSECRKKGDKNGKTIVALKVKPIKELPTPKSGD